MQAASNLVPFSRMRADTRLSTDDEEDLADAIIDQPRIDFQYNLPEEEIA